MSVELSEDARKLLRQVVTSGGEHSDGWVVDRIGWEAAELDYEAYVDAAKQLFENQLVEREGTDFAKLKATPRGLKMARGV